jgi:TRAP-type C4-dicarboxylate transport system permease small subunit
MATSATNLIFLFVAVFLLLMVAYAGVSAYQKNNNTDTTTTQDLTVQQNQDANNLQQPFLMGLGGFQMILLVVLVFGGIGMFLKIIFGRRRYD